MKKLKLAGILSGIVGILGVIYIIADKYYENQYLENVAQFQTIISGPDGPTSILLAGRLGGVNILTFVFTGLTVLISVITWIIYLQKKSKK